MTRQATFADLVAAGRATIEGEASRLEQLTGALGNFDPHFEIMPGTTAGAPADAGN